MSAISVDDGSTWPNRLTDAVREAAEQLRDTTQYTVDLRPTSAMLADLQAALDGLRVTVFHACRLLPHEVEDIRREGLAFAKSELFARKVRQAVGSGDLSDDHAARLLATTMPLDGSAGTRADQVCAAATTFAFREDPHAVLPLLTSWGGEVLYFAHERDELGSVLRQLGRPAVVEATVPALAVNDLWFPDLEACLIGATLGLGDVNADVFIRTTPVVATDVTAIHTPGSEWWAQFPGLPTA